MDETEDITENFSYISYGLHNDYTQSGSIKLTPKMLRLAIQIYFDALEHQSTYTVTKLKDVYRFYEEIGCSPSDNKLKVKGALRTRFPQPGLVKEFIDANKMQYSYSQSSKGIKRK